MGLNTFVDVELSTNWKRMTVCENECYEKETIPYITNDFNPYFKDVSGHVSSENNLGTKQTKNNSTCVRLVVCIVYILLNIHVTHSSVRGPCQKCFSILCVAILGSILQGKLTMNMYSIENEIPSSTANELMGGAFQHVQQHNINSLAWMTHMCSKGIVLTAMTKLVLCTKVVTKFPLSHHCH